jgi:hypothetical protein
MPVIIVGIIWTAVSIVLTPVIGSMLRSLLGERSDEHVMLREEADPTASDWRRAAPRVPGPPAAPSAPKLPAAFSEAPSELSRHG